MRPSNRREGKVRAEVEGRRMEREKRRREKVGKKGGKEREKDK